MSTISSTPPSHLAQMKSICPPLFRAFSNISDGRNTNPLNRYRDQKVKCPYSFGISLETEPKKFRKKWIRDRTDQQVETLLEQLFSQDVKTFYYYEDPYNIRMNWIRNSTDQHIERLFIRIYDNLRLKAYSIYLSSEGYKMNMFSISFKKVKLGSNLPITREVLSKIFDICISEPCKELATLQGIRISQRKYQAHLCR